MNFIILSLRFIYLTKHLKPGLKFCFQRSLRSLYLQSSLHHQIVIGCLVFTRFTACGQIQTFWMSSETSWPLLKRLKLVFLCLCSVCWRLRDMVCLQQTAACVESVWLQIICVLSSSWVFFLSFFVFLSSSPPGGYGQYSNARKLLYLWYSTVALLLLAQVILFEAAVS